MMRPQVSEKHTAGRPLPTIAIDGPAGAGKSTVARMVAERLGLTYIDTGAMYRAVTLKALWEGVDLGDFDALTRVAASARIDVISGGNGQKTLLDGRDVTLEVRGAEVGAAVALVAAVPGVRAVLVKLQRELASEGGVVMEGRDIGTRVLPEATHKFFITADPAVRAARRSRELGIMTTAGQAAVAREMAQRDRMDAGRKADPLTPACDAVVLDSTGRTAAEVAGAICAAVSGRS